MQFHVTPTHVKQRNRKSAFAALLLAALSIDCVVSLSGAKSASDVIFPAIGLVLFVPAIVRIVKHIRKGTRTYPVIDLDETSGTIAVSYKDIVVTVDITRIKNLRLQRKYDRLVSVIVTTSSGEVMRLEGYENLDMLAAALERLTPKDRVTNAKLYHR
jgi:hypothetical protein